MILRVLYGDDRRPVGRLVDEEGTGRVFFSYAPEWLAGGIELSPLHLPLGIGTELRTHDAPAFAGLHGLFHDCLPDYWGGLLLDARLRREGLDPERLSPLVRLSYLGARTMGALTFEPAAKDDPVSQAVTLAQMDREAQRVMAGQVGQSKEMLALLESGSSAGGAKPKILASLRGDELRVGGDVPAGWEGWLVKLSGIPAGHKDTKQEGKAEYAYSLMARAAGVDMPATKLFEVPAAKGPRGLFAVQRFDREGVSRRHVHTLSGLLQRDFRVPGATTYEDLADAIVEVTGNLRELRQVFRRLVFNVAACNCDDHAKNVALRMSVTGEWSLAPAYDLTFSPGFARTGLHAMSVGGSRAPGTKEIEEFAQKLAIPTWRELAAQVLDATGRWAEFGREAGLREATITKIGGALEDQRVALHGLVRVAMPLDDEDKAASATL